MTLISSSVARLSRFFINFGILFAGEYSNFSHGYQGDFQDTNKWSLSLDKV